MALQECGTYTSTAAEVPPPNWTARSDRRLARPPAMDKLMPVTSDSFMRGLNAGTCDYAATTVNGQVHKLHTMSLGVTHRGMALTMMMMLLQAHLGLRINVL